MNSSLLLLALFCVAGVALGRSAVKETREEGPACPIDDPLTIEAGRINVTLPPFLVIDEGSIQLGGVATGLSTLWYQYTINFITLRVDFQVTITRACVSGDSYTATGVIDAHPFRPETIPSGPFTGTGSYQGCVADFRVAGHAVILVNVFTNRISLRILQINTFTFSSLSANIEGLTVAGTAVNWDTWNANILANFNQDWNDHGVAIVEKARLSVNEELKKYTLAEFLELIGGGGGGDECPPKH